MRQAQYESFLCQPPGASTQSANRHHALVKAHAAAGGGPSGGGGRAAQEGKTHAADSSSASAAQAAADRAARVAARTAADAPAPRRPWQPSADEGKSTDDDGGAKGYAEAMGSAAAAPTGAGSASMAAHNSVLCSGRGKR